MERTIIWSNQKRNVILVIDKENNRCKYVYHDNVTGSEHDIKAPYPASKEEYIWHPIE